MNNTSIKLPSNNMKDNIIKLYLCAFFGNWAFATGILVFHYRELGFSFFQIFLITVVYEVLNFFLEIPTGVLADKWSCRKTIIIGYLISGISFFVVLIKPEVYITYVVWSILSAVCTTLNSGSVSAFTYNTVQEIDSNLYPKVLSKISAISLITQAISIIIGGILSDQIGFNVALLISGIGGIIQTIIFATTIEPRNQGQTQKVEDRSISQQFVDQVKSSFIILFKNQNVRFFLFYGILFFIISEFTGVIYQPYLGELGFSTKSIIAFFSAGSLLLMAASSFLCGHIKTRKNEVDLLLWISAGLCLSLVMLFIPKISIPAFVLLYLCIGADGIVLSDIINRFIPTDNRATVLSAQNQLSSISYSLFALLIGMSIDNLGMRLSSLLVGIILILSFSLLFSRNRVREIM